MKLKDFKKLFKGLPPDTEIMLVSDWNVDSGNGYPLLCNANSIEVFSELPQGANDDGVLIAYIYSDGY